MKVLVTGGGGFLGSAIVRQLLDRGDQVRTYHRGRYDHLEAWGAEQHQGDLTTGDGLAQAVDGVDAVIHTAAKAGVWGAELDYLRINVLGTSHVIEACRAAGVAPLVFTSSPSVTFSGRNESGVDESAPYPRGYLAAYPRTKARAEAMALQVNGMPVGDGDRRMATCALRPHLIWGPGDPHLAPRVVERAKAGRLRLVGDGSNRVDSTYVDNAAQAHLLALDRLCERGPDAACAGKAYFISNGEPIPMRDLLNRILSAADLPPVERRVSPGAAFAVGAALEAFHFMLGLTREPIMTRFVARQLATEHWYDLTAARRDLGYEPGVTLDEGMTHLAAWFREQARGEA